MLLVAEMMECSSGRCHARPTAGGGCPLGFPVTRSYQAVVASNLRTACPIGDLAQEADGPFHWFTSLPLAGQ